ncbi:MAG TPA: hypothetical protein VET86_14255 [Casimicrobiaceae bacterium]|nr:hypothetical protein [Casimicrobiaceae bacterium]
MRTVAAVVGGIVAWVVAATLGNFALRALLPGYAGVEQAMTFTFDMQAGRLVAGWIAREAGGRAAWLLAAILVLAFLPVHYGLWARFPLWYHLVFFASLVVATPAGAWLVPRGDAR